MTKRAGAVSYVSNLQADIYLAILATVRVCKKRNELVEIWRCAGKVLSPFLFAMVDTECIKQSGKIAGVPEVGIND